MKKSVKLTIQLLITVSVFYFLFKKFNLDLIGTFSHVNMYYIIVASFLRVFISPLIYINRWKLFLKYAGVEENFFTLLKISLTSAFIGVALPSSQGADMVRMYYIEKKHKGKNIKNTTSSTVIIERLIGFVLLALLGLISTLFCDFPDKEKVLSVILLINVALWMGILVITNNWCYKNIQSILLKIAIFKGVLSFIDKTYYSLINFPYKKVLMSSVSLILLLQINTILIVYCIFRAFGIEVPLMQHFVFYPIIGILTVVPISISGFGVREGFFVYFYSLVGVPANTAVSVSLVNYVVEILLVAIIGGIVFLCDTIHKTTKNGG